MRHPPARITAGRHPATAALLTVLSVVLLLAAGAAPALGLSFTDPARYRTAAGPLAVVAADLDGDGILDLVTADRDAAAVSLFLGRGNGRFLSRVDFPTGAGTRDVAVADLNADGALDLVTANFDAGTVSVLIGDGAGGVAGTTDVFTAAHPQAVATGYFDADDHVDVVTVDHDAGTVSLLSGDGAGGFLGGADVALGMYLSDVAVGDFDGDGAQDLATASQGDDDDGFVSVLHGDGAGDFAVAGSYRTYLQPYAVAVGDMNGDGLQDLTTSQDLQGSGNVGVLLGDGAGGFAGDHARDVTLCPDLSGLALADFNGDGQPDVASAKGQAVVVLRGDGLGGFQKTLRFTVGAASTAVAAGDFNRDGRQDLVVADYNGDTVGVLLNGPRERAVVERVSPARGSIGDFVTIVGRHFGAEQGRSVVRFGKTTATRYVSWTSTRIRVKVPRGTAAGRVEVRVSTVAGRSAPGYFVRL